ncbi:MAG TPA: glycosyltransferase [Ferruginibacter sp.]|nr:glycosyltransferase [Ferruginibacter sp.]HMP21259.1 glycosyltransferase [Ferruginibacter sp.]
MTTPLISVLMTAYNRQDYIAAAIESVLASSYKNFELIICDDCSADNTVQVARQYAAKDARVKVFINETNLGDYPNRNKAAAYASGKYIKYVDADDLIYPWGLQLLLECMEQFPGAGWGLCSLEQDNEQQYPFQLQPPDIFRYHYFNRSILHKAPLSSIINREVFMAAGGFTGRQHLGDVELWHLLAEAYPLVLMPHGMVWHRQHSAQQSHQNRTNPLVPFKYLVSALHYFQGAGGRAIAGSEKQKIIQLLQRRINKAFILRLRKLQLSTVFEMKRMLANKQYTFGHMQQL